MRGRRSKRRKKRLDFGLAPAGRVSALLGAIMFRNSGFAGNSIARRRLAICAALLLAPAFLVDAASACSSSDPRCIPTPQYRNNGGYRPSGGGSYSGGSYSGGGGYNYGAAIGAAGAAIEAAPVIIDLLGGILNTGADIASGVAATGGNLIDSGANVVSGVAATGSGAIDGASSSDTDSAPRGSGLSLPNPFKLFNPETAEAADNVPSCLKQSRFTGSRGHYRPVNACNEAVTFNYKTSERSFETNVRTGDLVFTSDRQTVTKKGAGESVWSNGGRPVLVSVCNSRGECYRPSNNEAASDRRQGGAAAGPSQAKQPRKQKTAEAKKKTETQPAKDQPLPNLPFADTLKDVFKSMSNPDQ